MGNWQTVEADEYNYPGVSVYLRLHFSRDFIVTRYLFYSYPEEDIYECTPYERMSQRDYFLESGYIYLPYSIHYLDHEIDGGYIPYNVNKNVLNIGGLEFHRTSEYILEQLQ